MRHRAVVLLLILLTPTVWAQEVAKQRPTGFRVPEPAQMKKVLRSQRLLSSVLKDAAGADFQWGPAAPDVNPNQLPASFNWEQRQGITEVRDQGSCGDCWAFATTAALEAAYKIRLHKTIDASEKNVLNCTPTDNCSGGMFQQAFELMRDHGIATENDDKYPQAPAIITKEACKDVAHPYHALNFDYVSLENLIPSNEALKKALVQRGPLAIGIHAGTEFDHFAGDGVFDKDEAGSPNHAVLLVGWDDQRGVAN